MRSAVVAHARRVYWQTSPASPTHHGPVCGDRALRCPSMRPLVRPLSVGGRRAAGPLVHHCGGAPRSCPGRWRSGLHDWPLVVVHMRPLVLVVAGLLHPKPALLPPASVNDPAVERKPPPPRSSRRCTSSDHIFTLFDIWKPRRRRGCRIAPSERSSRARILSAFVSCSCESMDAQTNDRTRERMVGEEGGGSSATITHAGCTAQPWCPHPIQRTTSYTMKHGARE